MNKGAIILLLLAISVVQVSGSISQVKATVCGKATPPGTWRVSSGSVSPTNQQSLDAVDGYTNGTIDFVLTNCSSSQTLNDTVTSLGATPLVLWFDGPQPCVTTSGGISSYSGSREQIKFSSSQTSALTVQYAATCASPASGGCTVLTCPPVVTPATFPGTPYISPVVALLGIIGIAVCIAILGIMVLRSRMEE